MRSPSREAAAPRAPQLVPAPSEEAAPPAEAAQAVVVAPAAVPQPEREPQPVEPPAPAKTCLVLSVGGAKGTAHIGAVHALRDAGIGLDCVYGNSMGAVIGGLYASSPKEDLGLRYRKFIADYVKETVAVKTGSAALEKLFDGIRQVIHSGRGWAEILNALTSGVYEALFSDRFDNARFQRVLDAYLHTAAMEKLPVPFATSYQTVKGQGLELGIITKGNVAEAVSRSANNPFIFKGTSLEYLDPGADRVAAVPIEDACQTFPGARLIAINVSGSSSHYHEPLGCPVIEVVVPTDHVLVEALKGEGPAYEVMYKAGYASTLAAIRQATLRAPGQQARH